MFIALALFLLLALALAAALLATMIVVFRKLSEALFLLLGRLLGESERQERT